MITKGDSMLPWASLALGVAVVAGLFIASCRKRYQGNRPALAGGIVGALGATLGLALPLAQFNGFQLSSWLMIVVGVVGGLATFGGFMFAESRRAPESNAG